MVDPISKYSRDIPIQTLVGKTFTKVKLNKRMDESSVYFYQGKDLKFRLDYPTHCCERIILVEQTGDIKNLQKTPIVSAEGVNFGGESFFRFVTEKGEVTLKFLKTDGCLRSIGEIKLHEHVDKGVMILLNIKKGINGEEYCRTWVFNDISYHGQFLFLFAIDLEHNSNLDENLVREESDYNSFSHYLASNCVQLFPKLVEDDFIKEWDKKYKDSFLEELFTFYERREDGSINIDSLKLSEVGISRICREKHSYWFINEFNSVETLLNILKELLGDNLEFYIIKDSDKVSLHTIVEELL